MPFTIRRRGLIVAIGGAAATWPLAATAQQRSMPVIGFLNGTSPRRYAPMVTAFHKGLQETGYTEASNAAVGIGGPMVSTTDCLEWLTI